ncbi:MAG: hypothetical protein AAFY31_12380 [Pseudomonadota bacterium]
MLNITNIKPATLLVLIPFGFAIDHLAKAAELTTGRLVIASGDNSDQIPDLQTDHAGVCVFSAFDTNAAVKPSARLTKPAGSSHGSDNTTHHGSTSSVDSLTIRQGAKLNSASCRAS